MTPQRISARGRLTLALAAALLALPAAGPSTARADLSGYLVFGANSVTAGDRFYVDGSVGSNSTVSLGGQGYVTGIVGSGGTLAYGTGTTIVGGTIEPPLYVPVVMPTPAVFSVNPSDPYVWTTGPAVTTLAPGQYSYAILDADNVLNLSAGTYTFGVLVAGADLQLNLDLSAGDITLYFVDGATWDNNLQMTLQNYTAGRSVYAETHWDWTVGPGGSSFGDVYAPYGPLALGDGCYHVGGLYGEDVILGDDVTIIPAPGAVALGGIGLAMLAWLKRRL